MHKLWGPRGAVNTTGCGRQLKSTPAYYLLRLAQALASPSLHTRDRRALLYGSTMAGCYVSHDTTPYLPLARLYSLW